MVQQPPHHAQTYAASDDGRTDFETQRQAFGQTDHIETDDGEAYVVAVERQDVEADSPAYKGSHSTAHACANVGANSSTKSSADSPAYEVSHSTAHACADVGANSSNESSADYE